MSDLFERGTHEGVRFPSGRGALTSEDLWHVPLFEGAINLNNIAKAINREINLDKEESFVVKKTKQNDILELKLAIVKRVIEVKLDAVDTATKQAVNDTKKKRILDIIANKEDIELVNTDISDLKKMLEEL